MGSGVNLRPNMQSKLCVFPSRAIWMISILGFTVPPDSSQKSFNNFFSFCRGLHTYPLFSFCFNLFDAISQRSSLVTQSLYSITSCKYQ